MLGSPVSHSRSPDLHRAAYAALGLDGWSYDAIETTADQVAERVRSAGPDWAGFSVTMPGKFAALEVADERTPRAELIGSANTLVRLADGRWRADCTDVDGMAGAMEAVEVDAGAERAVVIGAGGTSRPTIAALADRGIGHVTVVARDAGRATDALQLAAELNLQTGFVAFSDTGAVRDACSAADVVISTVPAEAAAALIPVAPTIARFVDVIYDPWPTPLASAVSEAGGQVVGGLVMLLNQAYSQVEQFTGRPAPRAAMAAALNF